MEDIGGFETGCLVGQAFLVNEQRKVDSGLFTKESGVICVSQTNSGQRCTRVSEFVFVFAQLRDVLTAEDSSVVTKENNHSRTSFPE